MIKIINKIKKMVFFSLIILVFNCFSSSILAVEKGNFNKNEKIIIDKANQYFINLSTIKSNFIQYNGFDDSMAEGIFYISKPNKLRFEYTNPFKALLITNGKITTFYDIDLDEISNIPTSKTPLSFLLQNNQSLDNENIEINSIKIDSETVIIETKYKYDENIYSITYVFDKEIETLKEIDFIDENKQEISLTLFNSEKNVKLDKSLFVFKNPRLYRIRK